MKEEPKEFMISLLLPDFPNHNPGDVMREYNRIAEKFKTQFPNVEIVYDSHSIDIYNPNADKGDAIKRYAQEAGISLEDAVIVGDSRGDFPGFKVINKESGLVVYVGMDKEVEKEFIAQFTNPWVSTAKKSSGLVEIMGLLLGSPFYV